MEIEKPKRPPTAFNLYLKELTTGHKGKADLKEIASAFRMLDLASKRRYIKEAEKAKKEHDAQMKDIEERRIKKPLTPYNCFFAEYVKKNYPIHKDLYEVVKQAGITWRNNLAGNQAQCWIDYAERKNAKMEEQYQKLRDDGIELIKFKKSTGKKTAKKNLRKTKPITPKTKKMTRRSKSAASKKSSKSGQSKNKSNVNTAENQKAKKSKGAAKNPINPKNIDAMQVLNSGQTAPEDYNQTLKRKASKMATSTSKSTSRSSAKKPKTIKPKSKLSAAKPKVTKTKKNKAGTSMSSKVKAKPRKRSIKK